MAPVGMLTLGQDLTKPEASVTCEKQKAVLWVIQIRGERDDICECDDG
jgi:hypothetical protein